VIHGTLVFEPAPTLHGDRACTFDAEVAGAAGLHSKGFVQEFQTRVHRGEVRGLYLRTDGGDGKLVRCASGAVVDVAVDLRPSSPTYRLWMTVVLDDLEHRSVWLPAGLAHGYQALTETADVCCCVNRVHRPECETRIRYDDADLAIPWPLPVREPSEPGEGPLALAMVEPLLHEWFGVLA